ncbi:MAG: uracil-DNA glycosylase [Brevinema sp.]
MDSINDLVRQVFTDEYIKSLHIDEEISQEVSETIYKEETYQNAPPKPIENTEKIKTQDEKPMPEKINNKPSHPDLATLYEECDSCNKCTLCESALNLVFGDGNPEAKIMVIGEAPGADEDEQGRPFVGRAGQLLIKLLNKYGVQREEIYIANILKHRPPNNRNPLPAEIEACTPFLRKQLEIIKPKLLLTLGNFSSQFILQTKEGITKIRGSIKESSFGMVMPTLHPSAIIRGAYPVQLLEDDIVKALEYAGYEITKIEE